ncbi:MAG: protein kinase [Bacillota bacterium]|nr:protein kinase [Bacillota bacterium]
MKGRILGDRYELIEKVGEGGMAIVYKARCRILDRIVAVKILKNEYANDASFVEKFRTEALSVGRISHPNIVNVYDVGQDDEIYFIVMEYIDGQSLNELIRQSAPLEVEQAIDIAIMICDAIHHAHEKGIIHRDIKPHNILITNDGMVKVADFGIARAINGATITYGKNIVGSVHYISPEQAKGEPLDRTTDIYSAGCVLYEMLTGRVPFEAESPITVALKHIHDEPVAPRSMNQDIPASIEAIITKSIDKHPSQRYQTAQEMRNALLNYHSQGGAEYTGRRRNDRTIIMAPVDCEGDDSDMRKKKKITPLGIVLMIAAILGLFLGGIYVLGDNFFGDEVAVPNVEEMNIKEANETLSDLGLVMTVIGEESSDEIEKDFIISQDPSAERNVKAGREIKVIISKGSELITVPNIRGIDIQEAAVRLRNKDLELGKTDKIFDAKYKEGLVISQDPYANTEVKPGVSVDVMVSKGERPERVKMPGLVGRTLEDANKLLNESNIILAGVTKEESIAFFENQVSSQDVASGVLVEEGSSVRIVLSTGPGPTAQIKSLEIKLPSDQEYYKVVIRVTDARGQREVYNMMHQAEDNVFAGVNYFGTGRAEVFLNGILDKTFELN